MHVAHATDDLNENERRAAEVCGFTPEDAFTAFRDFASRDSIDVSVHKLKSNSYWANRPKERVLCGTYLLYQMETKGSDTTTFKNELRFYRAIMASSFPLSRYEQARIKYDRRVKSASKKDDEYTTLMTCKYWGNSLNGTTLSASGNDLIVLQDRLLFATLFYYLLKETKEEQLDQIRGLEDLICRIVNRISFCNFPIMKEISNTNNQPNPPN